MQTNPESAAVEAVAVYVATAPERIYLQIADDEYYAQDPFPTGEEITWCADSVMALEVPYVRADLHQSALDALRGEVERLNFRLGLEQIRVYERDQKIKMLADKADAAERRVAECLKLAEVLSVIVRSPDVTIPQWHRIAGIADEFRAALTKESP